MKVEAVYGFYYGFILLFYTLLRFKGARACVIFVLRYILNIAPSVSLWTRCFFTAVFRIDILYTPLSVALEGEAERSTYKAYLLYTAKNGVAKLRTPALSTLTIGAWTWTDFDVPNKRRRARATRMV